MFYKIIPLDTLFFRNGRPFSMGAERWAELIFPPYPSTVYGAVRAWLIFEKGGLEKFRKEELKEELGTIKEKGTLKIKGPFIWINDVPYFPVPKDLLKEKRENKENRLFKLDLIEKPELIISDYNLKNVLINKSERCLEETDGFLDVFYLADYLKGEVNVLNFVSASKIYEKEIKVGIKRNRRTLTSDEECIYKVPMIRFLTKKIDEEKGFIIEIDGVESAPEEGVFHFGGETRLAKIKKLNSDPFQMLRDLNFEFKNKFFKVYLATPAIFEKGWIPGWINENTLEGMYREKIKIKLIACSIGKYKLIGGWDLANRKPKPMYKAVPAGSVYYFKILNEVKPEEVKELFHFANISDINSEEGFGLSFVGEVGR